MSGQRILVTGSAGRIGKAVVAALSSRGHSVTGYDRSVSQGCRRSVTGNLASGEAIYEACVSQNVVIHLAATPDDQPFPRPPPPDDMDNFLSELLPNNVIATYHVLEAARKSAVPRLVLASTGQVVSGNFARGDWPVTEATPLSPRYWYACTKVFLEAAGNAYSQAHGLEVLAVRLGWCPRDREQLAALCEFDWAQDVYLSPDDAGRFFVNVVEAPTLPKYSVVYATSRPVHRIRFDLRGAREICGFEPQDCWPQGADPTS